MLLRNRAAHLLLRFNDPDDIYAFEKHSVAATLNGPQRLYLAVDHMLWDQSYAARTLFPTFHMCGRAISFLRIDQNDMRIPNIDPVELFAALSYMPSLVDLFINVTDPLPDLSHDIETAPIQFRLHRLRLHILFRGWLRLLAQSRDTLHDLTLGCDPHRVVLDGPDADGSLGTLRSVTSLRLHNGHDPTLVHACPNLRTLALVTYGRAVSDMMPCLDAAPPTLRRLLVGYRASEPALEVMDIIHILEAYHPATARLQDIAIFFYSLPPEVVLRSLDAHNRLQALCHERRIVLSLSQ
ncbi:hypothetical protein EXIGLDRAFT_771512 [Exidia glandulosa HHB12029]|uniref:F-box domain-containing protein n=1 Tax=Exidia glandulosa HHB12029 TaxID=1314781 RepID=A0A166A928_EXIGL|nr:hypothetical protein EXIGLDRAFT_771512 [Exidia glandulosa HHB12029]